MRKMFFCSLFFLVAGIFMAVSPVFAEELVVNAADTAFILICAALVLLMTPGLAFFYGGMVGSKNVLATIMQSFIAVAVISVQWVLWGYSLSFGPDVGGFIGNLSWFGLNGVGTQPSPDYASTIPHQAFMVYQGMFAIITPALITGALVGRMKFSTYLVFLLLWSTLVYDPICHWVWGGGWLGGMGALDFAGGTVVHISSGVSALVAALVLGRRTGYPEEAMPPHNLPFTVLGAGLLWFGWFGFNAGSALAAGELSTVAFVTTNVAAAAATIAWILMDWIFRKKPTVLGAATGAVAGLVAITPAAGFVSPMAAILLGVLAGVVCFLAVNIRAKTGVDDSLDVFSVHGVGGILGALLTGVFANTLVNPDGADGMLHGNAGQLWVQFVGVIVVIVYAAVVTLILLKVLQAIMGLRVAVDHERTGLDQILHGETGYGS